MTVEEQLIHVKSKNRLNIINSSHSNATAPLLINPLHYY